MTESVGVGSLSSLNLVVSRGADNVYAMRWSTQSGETVTPKNLSTYSARSQFRSAIGGTVWLSLVSPTDISLDASGNIVISIPAATTEDAGWDSRNTGVWDMELVDGSGGVTRFVSGTVTVSQDVTRSV